MSVSVQSSSVTPSSLQAFPPPDALRVQSQGAPPLPTGSYRLEPGYHPQLGALFASNGSAANAAAFDTQVRGQDARSIDLDLMQISAAVYDPAVQQVGDWSRVGDAELMAAGIDPASLENPQSGFRAGIYVDGEGNHVLAFTGSNDVKDWTLANFRQGLGWESEQYDEAVQLAQLASAAYGDGLAITGHSLGGGLAATAAMAVDGAAVTFNASGVHDRTIASLGLDPATARADAADGQIRRYNVDGEALTQAQQDIWVVNGIPDAPGHEIVLDDPAPLTGFDRFNPVSIVSHSIAKHMQDVVIEALSQQQPWAH